ncbi:MAG: response regulator, partial [Gemmatimonadota bacterium]
LQDAGGYELELCASGTEALEAAPGFRPDLILLDVVMPELDGLATLEALRALPETADTPVIFLTARDRPEDVARLRDAGAMGVISKPFDPATLALEVARLYGAAAG